MNDQELRDLWDAVDTLRAQQHITNTMLAEIKTILCERCDVRGQRIDSLEQSLERVKSRVWWFAGASSVVAFIITKLWPTLVGK